jgi:NAD-dependent deacetylase
MFQQIETLKKYIAESKNIVFFGGAGVSTESGVPDFRSKDGLYNQHDIRFEQYSPEYLLSHSCLVDHPKVFYEYYRQKMDARHVKPNITHQVLAQMEEEGKLLAVVTQNIDGLHQKAGSKNVYELHGTTLRNYCSHCKKEYPSDYIFESEESVPRCTCGGMIRPDVTLYQESLPEESVDGALKAICSADMLIVGGTSLQVYPAAGFVRYFKGEHLIVINKEELKIPLDAEKDLFICGSLGDVFGKLVIHYKSSEIYEKL